MKNLKKVIPIILVAFTLLSFYKLFSNSGKADEEYEKVLTAARGYAEKRATKYALNSYNDALALKSSPEIYAEVADYLKENAPSSDYIDWCELFTEQYPKEIIAYEKLAEAEKSINDYNAFFDVISIAQRRGLSSGHLDEMAEELKYEYTLGYDNYDEIGGFGNNRYAVKYKGKWGYTSIYDSKTVAFRFDNAGAYNGDFAPVTDDSGESYYVDLEGQKALVPEEKYKKLGMYIFDIAAAQKENGRYEYIDGMQNRLFGDYEYATAINDGIGAVVQNGSWMLTDSTGKAVSDKKYCDVKTDNREIACLSGRIFAAENEGCYIMLDKSGKQVGNLVFEDAKTFGNDGIAAVKINGKWQFVTADGELYSDKKYEDAKSYSNGLAPVCENGRWGYADEKGTIVIGEEFEDALGFNANGSAFVKQNGKWKMIKIYRLNRKG